MSSGKKNQFLIKVDKKRINLTAFPKKRLLFYEAVKNLKL